MYENVSNAVNVYTVWIKSAHYLNANSYNSRNNVMLLRLKQQKNTK